MGKRIGPDEIKAFLERSDVGDDPTAQRGAEIIRQMQSDIARFEQRESKIVEALGRIGDGGRYLNDVLDRIRILREREQERAMGLDR